MKTLEFLSKASIMLFEASMIALLKVRYDVGQLTSCLNSQ